MTDEDRQKVLDSVRSTTLDKVVITHGTDTIHKTAETLSAVKGKTVVLTGAMLPEKFKDSDADFNLGMAVCAVRNLPHGIYIALYGEVKLWNEFKLSNASDAQEN